MFRFVSSVNLRRRLKFALIRVKFIHHFNVKCTQKTWPIVQKSILIATKHDILWVYRKSNAIWHASENYIIVYSFIMEMNVPQFITLTSLQWNHNGRDGVWNHQPHDCLLKRTFKCRSRKTSKLRVTGLCAEHSAVTGEFPAQIASNTENV